MSSLSNFTYYFVLYIILLHLLGKLSTSCHPLGHCQKDFIWISSHSPWQLAKSPWKIYKWSVKFTYWFIDFSKLLCIDRKLLCIAPEDIASGDSQQSQFSSRLCTWWEDFGRQDNEAFRAGHECDRLFETGRVVIDKDSKRDKKQLLINTDRETFDGYSDGYASIFSSVNVSTLTLLLTFNGTARLIFLESLKKNLNTYYPIPNIPSILNLTILQILCPWIVLWYWYVYMLMLLFYLFWYRFIRNLGKFLNSVGFQSLNLPLLTAGISAHCNPHNRILENTLIKSLFAVIYLLQFFKGFGWGSNVFLSFWFF